MKTIRKRKIDTLFVLIIFSVFALSVLMVLMLGARIYSNMTDMASEGEGERTVLSYIWTKVKNGDRAGSAYVGKFNGLDALYFDSEYEDEYEVVQYRTAIYQYDGWVYELFSETGLDFAPEDGVRVMRIDDDLSFENYEHGMIRVTAGTRTLLLSLRSETP